MGQRLTDNIERERDGKRGGRETGGGTGVVGSWRSIHDVVGTGSLKVGYHSHGFTWGPTSKRYIQAARRGDYGGGG